MQADQAEHFIVKQDRDNQKRARPHALGKEANLVVEFRRRGIVKFNRFTYIQILRKRGHIDRDPSINILRHFFRCAPFMTHRQFAVGSQSDNVRSIDLHHLAQLANYDLQKGVEIDGLRQVQRQPADDRLARFVELQLALERKAMLCFGNW